MVPPAQSSSFGVKPHRIVMPWMGWSLRSPEHLSQTGFGPRSDWRISTTVPCSVPSGARLISTMDLALPVSSSMVFQRSSGPDWAYAASEPSMATANSIDRMYMVVASPRAPSHLDASALMVPEQNGAAHKPP